MKNNCLKIIFTLILLLFSIINIIGVINIFVAIITLNPVVLRYALIFIIVGLIGIFDTLCVYYVFADNTNFDNNKENDDDNEKYYL